jgi:putative membrane protein
MDLVKSASIAYIHYLSFMLCFGALVFERISLKSNPSRKEAISMVIADVVYGIAGVALLISGIYRVIKFGQGSEFYTHNPIFWTKIVIFALVGSLSLYPTITYILWAIPLSKGKLPEVTANLVARLRLIINIELFGFSSIPLFASFMARGIGN